MGVELADQRHLKPEDVDLSRIRPLRDGLICRRLPQPTGSGLSDVIVIPDSHYETHRMGINCGFLKSTQSHRGVVVAVGPGKRDDDGELVPMEVQPGDVVWWGPYIDLEDGELVLIAEADVRFVEEPLRFHRVAFAYGKPLA